MTRYEYPGYGTGPQGATPTQAGLGAAQAFVLNGGSIAYDSGVKGIGNFGVKITGVAGQQSVVRSLVDTPDVLMGINRVITIPSELDSQTVWLMFGRHDASSSGSNGTAWALGVSNSAGGGDIVFGDLPIAGRYFTLLAHTAAGWQLGGKYRVKGYIKAGSSTGEVHLKIYAYGSTTVLGTLDQTGLNTSADKLSGYDWGILSTNHTAVHSVGMADPVSETGITTAPNDYSVSASAPSVSAGSSQYLQSGTTLSLSGASATAGSGTVQSTNWTTVSKPSGAADPAIQNASSLTAATVTGLVAGRYRFRLTVTDSSSSNTADVTEYVYPASGSDVGVYAEQAAPWTLGGSAASIAAALNDSDATTFAESPAGPAGQAEVLTMNPFGPGAITLTVSGYENGGDVARQVIVYKEDGSTVVYTDASYQLVSSDTDHVVTLDSNALALIPALADRRALVVKVLDTAV